MILEETYTLSNGVTIPKLGLGTWFIANDDAGQAVVDAVKIGYRHIDTAQAYGNEDGVGDGLRDSGVARDQMFVTTKLAAEVKAYDEAVASIDESYQIRLITFRCLLVGPPVEQRSFSNEFGHLLELATALGLYFAQFVQIPKVPVRQRLVGQFPQVLGWLQLR